MPDPIKPRDRTGTDQHQTTKQWRPKLTDVRLSDLGVTLVDCPVCGGKKTPGMECLDERICKEQALGSRTANHG
jgi:hypothetical protein